MAKRKRSSTKKPSPRKRAAIQRPARTRPVPKPAPAAPQPADARDTSQAPPVIQPQEQAPPAAEAPPPMTKLAALEAQLAASNVDETNITAILKQVQHKNTTLRLAIRAETDRICSV